MLRIRSTILRLSVAAILAGPSQASADVLVLKDGRLLLGDVRSVNGDKVELALGGAGSTSVSASSIRTTITCPVEERPDTYLKAARRAQRQGLLQEAAICYGKSVEAEPATAAAAQVELGALRREMTARATSRGFSNNTDLKRAEAQRLIAEGQAELLGAKMIQSFDTKQRGASAQAIPELGDVKAQAAETKIARGKEVLANLDAPKPAEGVAAVFSNLATLSQSTDWWGQNWQWVVGILLALILLLRFIRRSFFG